MTCFLQWSQDTCFFNHPFHDFCHAYEVTSVDVTHTNFYSPEIGSKNVNELMQVTLILNRFITYNYLLIYLVTWPGENVRPPSFRRSSSLLSCRILARFHAPSVGRAGRSPPVFGRPSVRPFRQPWKRRSGASTAYSLSVRISSLPPGTAPSSLSRLVAMPQLRPNAGLIQRRAPATCLSVSDTGSVDGVILASHCQRICTAQNGDISWSDETGGGWLSLKD